jgi:hypothetical protein
MISALRLSDVRHSQNLGRLSFLPTSRAPGSAVTTESTKGRSLAFLLFGIRHYGEQLDIAAHLPASPLSPKSQ